MNPPTAGQGLRLIKLPPELLVFIFHYVLQSDLPAVGARGHLLESSYADALRDWRRPPYFSASRCVPEECCCSWVSARSTQTSVCHVSDVGPVRSAWDLLLVCRTFHKIVMSDAFFWAESLLLHPRFMHLALTRALERKAPTLSFVAHGGVCLCVLDVVLQHFAIIHRLDIAVPSVDESDDVSPSDKVADALLKDARELQHLSIRFAAFISGSSRKKRVIKLQKLKTCHVLNAGFIVISEHLTELVLAAEDDDQRWPCEDLLSAVGGCRNLRVLSIQHILKDATLSSSSSRGAVPVIQPVKLDVLRYLQISEKILECQLIFANIIVPPNCRIHGDVMLPFDHRYNTSRMIAHCRSFITQPNLIDIGLRYRVAALRLRPGDTSQTVSHWPETMTICFGEDEYSAMAFHDSVNMESGGSFTIRGGPFPESRLWKTSTTGGVPLTHVLGSFIEGCRALGLEHLQTVIFDGRAPYLAVSRHWESLLLGLPGVRRLVLRGLRSFKTPHVTELAISLGKPFPRDRAQAPTEGEVYQFPCEDLRVIHLPDCEDALPQATVAALDRAMVERQEKGSLSRIRWTS